MEGSNGVDKAKRTTECEIPKRSGQRDERLRIEKMGGTEEEMKRLGHQDERERERGPWFGVTTHVPIQRAWKTCIELVFVILRFI